MAFNPLYDNITPYGAATPNRQGIHLAIAYQTKDNNLEANASMDMLTEIKGQGTTNLRTFNRMELGAVYHAGADLLNTKRLLDVSIHMRMDQTNRDVEDEGIPQVNLATNVIGVGLEAEIIQQLDLVAGVQMHSFSGFEFSTKTDTYGQIINFVEMEAEGQQQMLGAGVRFRFNDKVYLMGQYNRFDYSNSTNEIIPDYGMNQLALIYSMKF
jgi:hypothetical protein